MRIYLPATLPMLRDIVSSGTFRPAGGIGFAVTADLQAEYPSADTEDLEYVAMHDAALASLRLIAAGDMEPVRVVLAVDAASGDGDAAAAVAVTPRGDLDRAAVSVAGSIAWESIVSVHLDGGDVATVIRAAADAVTAADLGDMDAALAVGDAEDIDLAWYAASEIGYLVTELSSP
jgi:hypothetical protein